jgi:Berberine and berberine like
MYLFLRLVHLYLSSVGINFAASSRLIPRKYFETDAAGLTAAIRHGQTFLGSTAYTQQIQILADTPAPKFQKNKTSVTPAWYNSLWHVIYTTAWPNNATVNEQRKDIDGIHKAAQVLRDYAPDGGAYINEADVYEPNHEGSFWGTANAARLKDIKAKYDPNNVFQVWQGIGWAGAADVRYECYSQLNPGGDSLVDYFDSASTMIRWRERNERSA